MAGPDEKTRAHQEILAGRWRIDGRLGEGGMGSVLLGFDLTTHKQVAIKRLSEDLVDHPEYVTRFEREARLLAKLNHPALVSLLAVDQHEGRPFFVMNLVPGRTLERLMSKQERFSMREVLPLVRQLAEALDFLHARGIVHRDLKPANIMVDAGERVTLVDFGISQQQQATRLTSPGLVVGTPMYMAPEQIIHDEAGPAADVYTLALLTWRLLVGEHPFAGGPTEALLTRQAVEPPPLAHERNPALSAAVGLTLQRSLEKEPAARHPTALAFYEALADSARVDSTAKDTEDPGQTQGDAPATNLDPPASSAPPVAAPPARRFPWLLAAAGVVLLGLLLWGLLR